MWYKIIQNFNSLRCFVLEISSFEFDDHRGFRASAPSHTSWARPQAWGKPSALIVHSEPTDCQGSLWPGGNGGLPDSGCLVPLRKGGMWQSSRSASFSPAGLTLAELVRALARDSEWVINPGSNTSGVVGAGTLQLFQIHWNIVSAINDVP